MRLSVIEPRIVLIGWSYINQVLSLFIGLFQVKVLTQILSQDAYGLWVQINVAIPLLVIAAGLNLSHSLLRLGSGVEVELQQRYLATNLITQSALLLLTGVLLLPLSQKIQGFLGLSFPGLNEYGINFLGLLLALAWFTLFSNHLKNYLIITNRSLTMVRIDTVTMFTTMVCVVVAAWLKRSVIGVMVGALLGQLVVVSLHLVVSRLKVYALRFQMELLTAGIRIGTPLLLVSASYWGLIYSNRYFVNGFMGTESVAIFNVANVLPAMIVTVYTLLSSIFFSKISRLYDSGAYSEVSTWMSAAVKYYVVISVALAATLIVGSTQLTLLLANESYLFEDLALVYALVAAGSIIFGLFQLTSRVFDLENKPLRNSLNWILAVLLNGGLCWLLIPCCGLAGAGAAYVMSLTAGLVLSSRHSSEKLTWRVPKLKLAFYAVGSIGGALWVSVAWASDLALGPGLALALGIGLVVGTSGLLLRVLRREDLALMLGSVRMTDGVDGR